MIGNRELLENKTVPGLMTIITKKKCWSYNRLHIARSWMYRWGKYSDQAHYRSDWNAFFVVSQGFLSMSATSQIWREDTMTTDSISIPCRASEIRE
jgi:hypothetical protein